MSVIVYFIVGGNLRRPTEVFKSESSRREFEAGRNWLEHDAWESGFRFMSSSGRIRSLCALALVAAILGQATFFVWPRVGSQLRDPFRRRERIAAFRASNESPSIASSANLNKELALLDDHLSYLQFEFLAFILAIDTFLAYLTWRRGRVTKSLESESTVP
jgi:hypothetical protein